jgi:hypothetical protein
VRFAEGDFTGAVGDLFPVRQIVHEFGGSHAQRGAIQRTLVEAALRSGDHALVDGLLAERLGLREASSWDWRAVAAALAARGDTPGSARATERADRLVADITAAVG